MITEVLSVISLISIIYLLLQHSPNIHSSLRNKVILICGASSGIGEELALQLAQHHTYLALVARSADKLERVKSGVLTRGAVEAITIVYDFSDVENSGNVVDEVVGKFGRLDYLILNHGAIVSGPILAFKSMQQPDYINKIFNVNVLSHLQVFLRALPHLEKSHGHVFVTSSLAGEVPFYHSPIYCSTKHALSGLFYSLQQELLAKKSQASITLGSFGIIWTKELSVLMERESASYPSWFKGSLSDCVRRIIACYVTRVQTLSFPRVFSYFSRVLWYVVPGYHKTVLWITRPQGATGSGYQETVEGVRENQGKKEEMGYQCGYSGA